MPKEVDPKDTTRAAAYALWMKAPNPMVTFFKTFDVTNLIKVSRKRSLKFNMLLDYCIGRAAVKVKEFYILPVGDKLIQYDTIAVNTIVKNKEGEVSSCDLSYNAELNQFNEEYLKYTAQVAANLEIIRKILGLPKSSVDDALELVGLTEFRKRLAKKYSLGMKQRLGLAGALIGRPPILILDEPTNGLDPVGIHEIRTLIRSLPQKYDCTVLVSSHLLPEVELMADDIGILNHGHLLFEGTKEELKTSARAAGFPTDNLEDTFLAMIDEDNRRRGGTV